MKNIFIENIRWLKVVVGVTLPQPMISLLYHASKEGAMCLLASQTIHSKSNAHVVVSYSELRHAVFFSIITSLYNHQPQAEWLSKSQIT